MPIALDEGCFSSYDVARLARMEAGDLVVLKLTKSAGPWGCQRSAIVAEANGLGLLGSGLTDSAWASPPPSICIPRLNSSFRLN